MSFSDFENWARKNAKIVAFSGFKGSGKDTTAECIVSALENRKSSYGYIVDIVSMAEPIRKLMFDSMRIMNPDYTEKDKPYKECTYSNYKCGGFWNYSLSVWAKQFNAKSYRDIVNLIGTGIRERFSDTFWITAAEVNIKERLYSYYDYYDYYNVNCLNGNDNCLNGNPRFIIIIPDIRYKKEINWLKKLKNSGYDVEHWCIFRKAVLPEWTKYGLDVRNPVHVSIIEKDFKPTKHEFEWCKTNPKFNRVITNDGSIEDLQKTIDKIVEKW